MVSVICSNFLSKAFNEEQIYEPAAILNRVRELVINKFGNSAEEIRDGMDISFCALNLFGWKYKLLNKYEMFG